MAKSKYIQSVLKAAGGRPKSTQWFRDKIKEFGTPTSANLIRDGKKTSAHQSLKMKRQSTHLIFGKVQTLNLKSER